MAETATMLLAVLIVWTSTSWSATIVRARSARPTLMLLAVMGLGLFMNAAIVRAFEGSGWSFILPLVIIEIGRTLWTFAFAPDADYREHYQRTLVWVFGGAPLWIAGAVTGPEWRLVWWAVAAMVQIIGIWTAHPVPGKRLHSRAMPFDAPHFLERCALFLLIALGETVISTGLALSQSALDGDAISAGLCALLGTTAMWSIIFGPSYDISHEHLQRTSDPVRAGRAAVNAVTLMVGGLICSATANQVLIDQAHGQVSLPAQLPLTAGPVLFLLGHLVYMTHMPGFRPVRHLWGIAALLLSGLATWMLSPLGGLALMSVVLLVIALVDRLLGSDRVA